MYHCHIDFYLVGEGRRVFEIIRQMAPLEHFTHGFFESDGPERALAAKADVILADTQGTDAARMLEILLAAKGDGVPVIWLAQEGQTDAMRERFSEISDVWMLPMSDEMVRFRFLRWQESCKRDKDFWQTGQYLESTINSIPNLIWYKDKEGIHRKVNDSFCRTVNKTKEQVEGKDHYFIWDVDPEEAGEDCMESDREAMQKKRTCVSEETVETGDGTRLMTTYKSPLYDLDGSVMGTVGIGIDVTQERAYEQEIVKKNETLETIFTALECGIITHTLDGKRIIWNNRAALRILGYETQEEMMKDGFDMVAQSVMDEDKPKLRESIATLQKDGDSVNVEYRVRHADGEILHVMGNIKFVNENGRRFYQRFLLDITAQKMQEKRNERRQAELVQALSIDYNFVFLCDLDAHTGVSLRIAGESGRIFSSYFADGGDYRESMERYAKELVYEGDREMFRECASPERMGRELAVKSFYNVNFRIAGDGEVTYYEMKAVRAGEWDEGRSVVLGFRSMDEEIRREMEQKTILEEALAQANRANAAKSAFLSNMSHDMRTPMNAIVGFTSLAATHIDEKERVADYLDKIANSGNHLLALINDVLDMSRIESGKLQLEEAPCSLREILEELQTIVQTDVQAKNQDFRIDMDSLTDGEVCCDKLRLSQVLLNIVGNSVKYTAEGGKITLTATETNGGNAGYVKYDFVIRDNGIGMSKEFLNRIYEPFEREKNTTISGVQGTGLGMAITKNIVNIMNGIIAVESEQGVGTTVRLSFSFRPSHVPEVLEESPEQTRPSVRRLLLVEDNELNQEIALAILEDAGIAAEVADNGQIAVDMLKASAPGYYELILMDVQMPVMNGYEATKAIRALDDERLASIPILAMTANVFEEDKQRALEAGMNGHIGKPIDVEQLFGAMQTVTT